MHKYNRVLIQAIRQAGEIIKSYFGQKYDINHKQYLGQKSIVTSVDQICEQSIISLIHQYYPQHSICSEESGLIIRDPNFQWIIDPIDGTLNFVRNIPLCTCSIALKIGGKTVIGAVYNPFSEELFSATLGEGAKLNNNRIQVSKNIVFEDSCLLLGLRHNPKYDSKYLLTLVKQCLEHHISIRQLGAASLNMSWVASGHADAYYQGTQLELWDIAAAELILTEAGGKIDNFEFGENNYGFPGFLASNGNILKEFLKFFT